MLRKGKPEPLPPAVLKILKRLIPEIQDLTEDDTGTLMCAVVQAFCLKVEKRL